MKAILSLLICICSVYSSSVFAHESTAKMTEQPTPITNRDCYAALELCNSGTIFQKFDFSKDPRGCSLGITKLFYFFKANSNGSFSIGNVSTSLPSTYQIYGPFDQFQDGCERINSLSVKIEKSDTSTTHDVNSTFQNGKYYLVEVNIFGCEGQIHFEVDNKFMSCGKEISCENCIPQFNPGKGQYIVSAWVKQADATPSTTTYPDPHVKISFPSSSSTFDFYASGQIIDGWQRIEGTFDVSSNGDMILELLSDGGTCFFDDIRIFPFDGSMISYVYDPITLRLVAELDERNYAKIYEYDEEGKLIRVKKETEKGIMTIQENRENSVKY